jgi:flavoprotein
MPTKAIGAFRDSKLNKCDSCGSCKQIAPLFDANGGLYFLCVVDMAILDRLAEQALKAGFGFKL